MHRLHSINKVLTYSIKNNMAHIPSALSQYSYLKYILPQVKDFKIVIGKPFGAQAYYVIWQDMYNLPEKLSYGVKHEELDFVEFSEETLGNALGVAAGIALSQDKPVYCNISDGALQMGPTLEAIQFIGKHKLNILLTVDVNGYQLTGKTDEIIGINYKKIKRVFTTDGWHVYSNKYDINTLKYPCVIIYKTTKGKGVKYMENDPVKWHYKIPKE